MKILVILISCLFLLLQAWCGWRRGVVRQGLNLFAMVCALAAGYSAYHIYGSHAGGTLFSSILGLFLGWIVYFCIALLAAILFKKTDQHESVMVRLFYGLGGAACGIATGAVLLWGVFFFINSPHGATVRRSSSATETRVLLRKDLGVEVAALEESAGSAFEIFNKMGRVISNQSARIRFFRYPGIKKIMDTKAVSELLRTPQFAEAASRHDVVTLLLNARLYQTMQDPEVEQAVRNVNFKKALDYALFE